MAMGSRVAFLIFYFIILVACVATDGAGGYYYPAVIFGVAFATIFAELFRYDD